MMSPDFEDPLAKRLFDAARREAPRAEVRARTARAVAERRKSSLFAVSKFALAAAFAVFAAGAFALFRTSAPAPSIGPERLAEEAQRTSELAGRTGLPRPTQLSGPDPASTAAPSASVAPPAARSAAPKAKLTQREELELLDRARELLTQGAADQALASLDRYDRTPSERSLGAEATLLRIQALAAMGRRADAAALAKRFVTEHPNSPLADRARSFFEPPLHAVDAGAQGTEP